MVIIISLLTIVSTLLGGLFAIKLKDKLHLILGFSAGAVIGVALFDLVPESIWLATKNYDTSIVTLLMAVGFCVYMILDRFFTMHSHGDSHCENKNHSGGLGAAALCFHSMLDGLGIGLAFKVSPEVGWVVAAAVLAHDFSDGINTVNMIVKNNGNRAQALRWLGIDAFAPVAGVLIAQLITVNESVLGLILGVFTGLFLYIGASDLIPESHHKHPAAWTTISTILGIAVLYAAIHIAG